MTKHTSYNKLNHAAQQVWAATDIQVKKQIIVDQMIEQFAFSAKAAKFRADVAAAASGSKLDKLAADLILLQSGDRVIRIA